LKANSLITRISNGPITHFLPTGNTVNSYQAFISIN